MAVAATSVYCDPTVFRVLLLVLATTLVASSVHAEGASRPAFGPPGAWVRESPLPETSVPATGESQPTATLLFDRQIRIGKDQETFVRRVYRVLSQTGVENGSQIEWEFDPLYERLTLHFVRIHRAGRIIDALRPSEIKVVQRETDLEARIYNGSESALLFVHDVRVGDVIDYAYTVVGSNPIVRGKASARLRLAERAPTARMSIRLLLEGDRSVDVKTFGIEIAPTILKNESATEYLWTRNDVPAIVVDDQVPSWFNPFPSVEATEFRSWNEVATWASEVFERKLETSSAMREAVARFAQGPDLSSRALSAIRFVQDEVRYLGIELGENSHQPFAPTTVLERRFGDCKDKSLLLVTFLRELGIEARVALVNTDLGARVADHAPSPFAFDHAIVVFHLDGRDIFVDPTQMPLGLEHPDFVAQTIEVVLPEDYDIESETKEITSSGFKFNFAAVNLEKRFRLRYEYRTLRDSVDSSDMDRYRAKLDEVKEQMGYSINRGSAIRRSATPDERKFVAWVLGGLVTGVVGIAGIGAAVTRGPSYLRLRRFRRKQQLASGEGPASAIPASGDAERRRHLDRFKCACGGRWGGPEEQNRVRYGDAYITVVRGSCASCGQEHRLYFSQALH